MLIDCWVKEVVSIDRLIGSCVEWVGLVGVKPLRNTLQVDLVGLMGLVKGRRRVVDDWGVVVFVADRVTDLLISN